MHTIILPYFCDEEVDRYERILAHMQTLGPQRSPFEFLLASSPKTTASDRLMRAALNVAPSRHFACPSQVFGYPQGPSAMFWDCMDRVAADHPDGDGFALWLESDMCPVKGDWLDRLDTQWRQCGDVFVMGCVIPELYREKRESFKIRHPFRKRRVQSVKWISEHINGGACYRCDLVRHVDDRFRDGIFDMEIGVMVGEIGGFADTPALSFSTMWRIDEDLRDPHKVILHGYLQNKDLFLDACIDGPQSGDVVETRVQAADAWKASRDAHPSEPMLDAVLAAKDSETPQLRIRPRTDVPTSRRIAA